MSIEKRRRAVELAERIESDFEELRELFDPFWPYRMYYEEFDLKIESLKKRALRELAAAERARMNKQPNTKLQ